MRPAHLTIQRRLFLFALTVSVRPAFAACEAPLSGVALDELLRVQEKAIEALDSAAFSANFERMDSTLPCLDTVITPDQAAAIHRMHGVQAVLSDHPSEAAQAFAAARALSPDWPMLRSFAEDNPIVVAWLGAPLTEATPRPLNLPGSWVVDGTLAHHVPESWPSVVQEVKGGNVYATTYLLPGVMPVSVVPRAPKGAVPLTVGAVSAAVVAGGLMGVGAWSANDMAEATTSGEIVADANRTNVLGWSGVGFGVVAAGLTVGAVVAWVW